MFDELRNKLLQHHTEKDFLNGGCYVFAKLVVDQYGGQIYINQQLKHCAVMYEGKLYDIHGHIKDTINYHAIKPWEKNVCEKEYKFFTNSSNESIN